MGKSDKENCFNPYMDSARIRSPKLQAIMDSHSATDADEFFDAMDEDIDLWEKELYSNAPTIAAISSGQMPAAVGIVRISGPNSLGIVQKCLHQKTLKPRMMHARTLYHPQCDEKIDEVLVCFFKGPHSFTGEDSVEIYAHGGLTNLSRVLDAICCAGARLAEPGEFSKRAFLNGKIDLSQAEAIMDVIHAQNSRQCREAQRQLSGSVSKSVEELRASVMSILCAVEASIDFSSEEELAPLPVEQIRNGGRMLLDQMKRMQRAHEQYRAGGMKTVFVGRPNAGKSSLFNCLLGHDRAIVTQIAGTTTDTIESQVTIGTELFTLVDTAGVTETDNLVEKIGVERARDQIQNADLLLLLFDAASSDVDILKELREILADSLRKTLDENRILVVRTKVDLTEKCPIPSELAVFIEQNHLPIFEISVQTRQGLDELENALVQASQRMNSQFENVTLITSQRHIMQLSSASQAIERSLASLEAGMPAECIAADLHEAADALAQITGTIASEDVINEIFSHFCVGK